MSQVVRKEPQRSSTSRKDSYHYLTGTWEQNNTHLSAQNYESWLSSLRRISVKTNKMTRDEVTHEYLHGIVCLGPSRRGEVEKQHHDASLDQH